MAISAEERSTLEALQSRLEVDDAMAVLRASVEQTIRRAAQIDRLTRLANDAALDEALRFLVEKGSRFWIAFVEVDRFKSINDRFGYSAADVLLVRVADQLRNACSFFPEDAMPVRAHGDEFYLVGIDAEAGDIASGLEALRQAIAAVRVNVEGKGTASCTVSIGWLMSADLLDEEGLTDRRVMSSLELAVASAKVDRDKVVRFSKSMRHVDTAEGRTDCAGCRAKFTLTIARERCGSADLWCPACGERLTRPASLMSAPVDEAPG